MNSMNSIARSVVKFDIFLTFLILCILGATSVLAFIVLGTWLTFPHLLMLWLANGKEEINARNLILAPFVAIKISVGGVLYLGCILVSPPDAQGAIAVFATPMYQLAAAAIGVPIAFAFGRK